MEVCTDKLAMGYWPRSATQSATRLGKTGGSALTTTESEMGREYKAGEECVPGYRLAKFLGRGGFGEVWRAVGPGGTEVALKLIALDRKQGMKEFRSLRLVKRIHHPNLVPILAFWLIDANGTPLDDESIDLLGSNLIDSSRQANAAGTATMQFNVARAEQLIIAMGLGEKNLLDVLKEYQAKGLAGIPLDELLDFMEGSARAIDFLNTARHDLGGPQPVAIQHCDIKPQNIMLVGDAVQVCDFGLARSLSDVRSTSVAASIAYGAPELFWENKPTHATDQYSLPSPIMSCAPAICRSAPMRPRSRSCRLTVTAISTCTI